MSGFEVFILPHSFLCTLKRPAEVTVWLERVRSFVARNIFVPKSLTRKNEVRLASLIRTPIWREPNVQGFS